MQSCAYCDILCQQTREHVIPRWYNDTPGDAETFSARAPLTHIQGNLIVRDVCQSCNNGSLASLDAYGKELYDRYFHSPVYEGETLNFEYDGGRLIRWLLKLSYNSARAQNADIGVLYEYRSVLLGKSAIPNRIQCWLRLLAPTYYDSKRELARPARRDEKGHANVEEPLWFRIGQFRLASYPAPLLVQRTVIINSFAFTLLVERADAASPNSDFDQWAKVFDSIYPDAQRILPDGGSLNAKTGADHAAASIEFSMVNYPSRFSADSNPFISQILEFVKNRSPIIMLRVPFELIENGDTILIASALQMMASTREYAAIFKQRVGIMVDGFDDEPRALWQVPKVRAFFRRLFDQCPFVMLLTHPDGALLKLLAACWLYEDGVSEEGQRARMKEFLLSAFDGLNRLTHILALSEEQNREICMAASTVLFGETPPEE
jgi:hypothetical protein